MPVSSSDEDQRLVSALLAGDRDTQHAWVRSQQRPVFALLSRMLRGKAGTAEVEELAQETFLRAFRALNSFKPEGPARLSTWVLRIATNLAIDRLRQIERRPRLTVVTADDEGEADLLHTAGGIAASKPGSDSDLEAEYRRRELARCLDRAVEDLSPPFRAAFLLRVHHQLEYSEIARELNLDVGTVKSRISRARTRLRHALKEKFDD